MKPCVSLLLALGLLFPFLSAFADDSSAVPKNICADELTPTRCPVLYKQFNCASFSSKRANGDTSAFLKVINARCRDEPGGFCANPKTPEVASSCNLGCQRVVEQDRVLVCTNCAAAIPAPASPPAQPPAKTDPAPSVPPIAVGNGGGNKTPPGQNEGGLAETPSGRPTVTPSGKRESTVTGNSGSACDSSEQCLREANETDRAAEAAARARKEENLRGMRESRENEVSTVSGAADFLNSWKRQLDANPAAVTAETRAKFLSDQRLVQQAQAAFPPGGATGHGSFTAEDALRANDEGIMRELSLTVESAAQVKDFSKEAKKAKTEEDKFHALALETDHRMQALQIIPGSPSIGGPASPAIAASNIAVSPIAPESKNGESSLAISAKDLLAADNVPAKRVSAAAGGGLSGKSAAAPTPVITPAGDASNDLRDRLRKRLSERGEANGAAETHDAHDALDGTTFGRQGGLESNSGARVPASAASPAGKSIAEEVMGDFSAPREKHFTMKTSDVDAELHRLTQEASEAGLLGEESVSLFDRVRQAHKSCLQRDCVISR